MAIFVRKHNNENLYKKKAKILCHHKDFSFLCFLMKMPLGVRFLFPFGKKEGI